MRSRLVHYTINSADTFDCSSKNFDATVIRSLAPIVNRAIAEVQTQSALPSPMEAYSVKITVDSDSNGAALFDLYSGQDLITVNAIAWTKEGAAAVWDMFETLYLKLSGQMGVFMRSPSQPQTLPWLATIVLPSEQLVNWMADFEQCLAIALIKQCDRKSKTKGFGK